MGVALVVRPGIEGCRTPDGVSADGVYYAGTTLGVLGYGDITPVGTGPRLLSTSPSRCSAAQSPSPGPYGALSAPRSVPYRLLPRWASGRSRARLPHGCMSSR
ncbi:potassium channel family protein [Actinoplanes auranticolor]|uniref:potassium channel family protein n=1 Tax=Actinoplanes auranticolor TaxID=47988 RepID=UPI0034DB05DE